ncbi:MAG TPA: hypothetical protein VNW90_10815 [Acetobacteraceae bacterium]|jgi:hypothetical protein|nr:hypothetical protein [Acetobacteraceae bacterium]
MDQQTEPQSERAVMTGASKRRAHDREQIARLIVAMEAPVWNYLEVDRTDVTRGHEVYSAAVAVMAEIVVAICGGPLDRPARKRAVASIADAVSAEIVDMQRRVVGNA